MSQSRVRRHPSGTECGGVEGARELQSVHYPTDGCRGQIGLSSDCRGAPCHGKLLEGEQRGSAWGFRNVRLTWDNISSIERVLVLDESEPGHELDLSDASMSMFPEMLLDVFFSDYSQILVSVLWPNGQGSPRGWVLHSRNTRGQGSLLPGKSLLHTSVW